MAILDPTFVTVATVSSTGEITGTSVTAPLVKSNSFDSTVPDSGVINIGTGTVRSGNINIGTGKNTNSVQIIAIGSGDNNATGQVIRFSRPIQLPSFVQTSDKELGFTFNYTATTTGYVSGTGPIQLTIPATLFYSDANYMFKCSLSISSTVTKTLTSIKFGLNRSNAPIGYITGCYNDMLINTGTAVVLTNKIYQLSSFFRYAPSGSYTFDYAISYTGTAGTLSVVAFIEFIRIG